MTRALLSLSFTERALAVAFGASGGLLLAAHLYERLAGLAPCILCLDQREAHWTALAVAAAGLVAARLFRSRLGAAAAVGAAALVYAVSAGLAFYHTGVEYNFWPGPRICAGGVSVDINAISAALESNETPPSCEDPQWRFLGVSMAGYNMLISAGLFALTLAAAVAEARHARARRLDPAARQDAS